MRHHTETIFPLYNQKYILSFLLFFFENKENQITYFISFFKSIPGPWKHCSSGWVKPRTISIFFFRLYVHH